MMGRVMKFSGAVAYLLLAERKFPRCFLVGLLLEHAAALWFSPCVIEWLDT
jgi:hypothetical protein